MTGRKPREGSWRELPPAGMAAHLLAKETIADRYWTSEPRLPREKRSDFVRRVLLGETAGGDSDARRPEPDARGAKPDTHRREPDRPEAEPDTHYPEAAKPA